MARRFAELLFTPAVQEAQARYGGRADRLLTGSADPQDRLGPDEVEFLQTRDGFHLATVGESGWPYVQFRGGPPGFLHVLDDHTIAWADFRGNRQYVSTGNLGAGAGRVAIIAMDQAQRARMKLLGTARIVDAADDPELASRVTVPDYHAIVERVVVVTVAAFDWNCPQHITPRYTVDEVRESVVPLVEQVKRLQAENARLRAQLPAEAGAPEVTAG